MLTSTLRTAILRFHDPESGQSYRELASRSGVAVSVITKFAKGETVMAMDVADKVCKVLGYELTKVRETKS